MDRETRGPRRDEALYEDLTILDGKASALLAFNAIFVTALSVWLGRVPPNFLHIALDVIFLAVLVSSGLLLSVVRLVWRDDFGAEARNLEVVRRRRSRRYRAALLLSGLAVAATVAITVVHAVGNALITFDLCGEGCARFYGPEVFGGLAGVAR